jgi:DNA-binding transcriptional regulator of glucitol operon
MRIKVGVGDLVWRIGDDQAQVGYLVAGRSGGRMTPYAIRIIHVEETRSVGFPI